MGKFDKILSRLAKAPLDIYPEQCSKNRDRNSSCQKCFEVCPTKVLSSGPPSSEEIFDCNSCGLCATVCPNGVFEPKEPTDGQILSQIEINLKYNLQPVFICHKFPEIKNAIRVFCLGRINEAILIGSAALGAKTVWLNTEQCEGCEIERGREVGNETAHIAKQILSALNIQTEIIFSPEAQPEIQNQLLEAEPVTESALHYSRRDFLSRLRRGALTTGALLIESSLPFSLEQKGGGPGLKYRLPGKRTLLINAIKKLATSAQEKGLMIKSEMPTDELPFRDVEINNQCSVCGLCAFFCPTRAIVKNETEEKGGLEFALSYCTACDLCKIVCPDQALTYSETIRLTDFLKEERKPILTYDVYLCAQCGMKFGSLAVGAIHESPLLCRFCQKKQDLFLY